MELRGYLCDSVLIFFLCLVGDVFKMFDDFRLFLRDIDCQVQD
jgi:hypothetical protein